MTARGITGWALFELLFGDYSEPSFVRIGFGPYRIGCRGHMNGTFYNHAASKVTDLADSQNALSTKCGFGKFKRRCPIKSFLFETWPH